MTWTGWQYELWDVIVNAPDYEQPKSEQEMASALAVARHVLADADCWRQRLGMGRDLPAFADTRPVTPAEADELRAHVEQPRYTPSRPPRSIPEVAGYHHHTTEPRAPYALPTVYWGTDGYRHGSNHSVLEQRLANAGDRRDWDECDRLERASLSGAEGQE